MSSQPAAAHASNTPRLWKSALSSVLGAGLLLLVVSRVDWSGVWQVLRDADLRLLPAAVGLIALHYVCKGPRWAVLLSSRATVQPLLAIRLTFVGFLFNNVLPARLGELSRPWLLHVNPPRVPFPFALATVLADKLFDLALVLVFLLASALVLPLSPQVRAGAVTLAAACLLAFTAILLAARWRGGRVAGSSRLHALLARVLGELAAGLAAAWSLRRAGMAFAYTLAAFSLLGLSLHLTLLMVGIHAPAWATVFIIGFLGVAFIIPAPPTQVGNYHFFVTQAVALLGLADPERALAFAILAHAIQVVTVTLGGLLSLMGLDWRSAPPPPPTTARPAPTP